MTQMTDLMHYAFIDESGTVGAPGRTHYLVVAVLIAGRARDVEMPVRRALKKFGRSLRRGEIKAANFEESAIARFLREIAKVDVSILATIVNQSVIQRPPCEMEEIYRRAVAQTVYRLVERYPRIDICLDKRYTNQRHRFALEKHIRESIQDLPQKIVLIRQEDSVRCKELQAVDAVAWAMFQKYERGKDQFYEIISPRIMLEEFIEDEDWTKKESPGREK